MDSTSPRSKYTDSSPYFAEILEADLWCFWLFFFGCFGSSHERKKEFWSASLRRIKIYIKLRAIIIITTQKIQQEKLISPMMIRAAFLVRKTTTNNHEERRSSSSHHHHAGGENMIQNECWREKPKKCRARMFPKIHRYRDKIILTFGSSWRISPRQLSRR